MRRSSIRPSFASQCLLVDWEGEAACDEGRRHKRARTYPWVTRCVETVLERPWGGTGDSCVVSRLFVDVEDDGSRTFIVKRVVGPSDRYQGWDALKTEIKRVSYKVEGDFLKSVSQAWSDSSALRKLRIARALYWNDQSRYISTLIEQDLNAEGYTEHVSDLEERTLALALNWLAEFHTSTWPWIHPQRLWKRGGYWSLDKRSEEICKLRFHYRNFYKEQVRLNQACPTPKNLASRLIGISRVLDKFLYPLGGKLPWTQEQEQRFYDSEDGEEERVSYVRESARRHCKGVIMKEMITAVGLLSSEIDLSAPHPFLGSVIVHGDFKAENLFFNDTCCSACDFQWTGYGLGVLDLVSLLSSSLPSVSCNTIRDALGKYCAAFYSCQGEPTTELFLEKQTNFLYWIFTWGVVDYVRYLVGTGCLHIEDLFYLELACETLNTLDHGECLEDYEQAFDAMLKEQVDALRHTATVD